jgi:uncharacterized protein YggT (Ycf19 family)
MSATPVQAAAPPTESTGHETQIWLLRAAKAVVVLVYAFVLIDLVLLTLAFFLRLFGASIDAEFTQWVYRSAERVMEPFRGMFPTHALSEQSVLDVSLLFAMIVYSILGIALHGLVVWLTGKIATLRQRQRIAAMQQSWTGAPVAPLPETAYAPPPPGAPAGTTGAPGPP